MDNFFIKPRDIAGAPAIIPDPHAGGQPLKAEGEWKPMSPFWLRRQRDGDVVEDKRHRRGKNRPSNKVDDPAPPPSTNEPQD